MKFTAKTDSYIESYDLVISSAYKTSFRSGLALVKGPDEQSVFRLGYAPNCPKQMVMLSRENKNFIFGMEDDEDIILTPFQKNMQEPCNIELYISLEGKARVRRLNVDEFEAHIRRTLSNYYLNHRQTYTLSYKDAEFMLRIKIQNEIPVELSEQVSIKFCKEPHQQFQLVSDEDTEQVLDGGDFKSKLARIKVGGLEKQIGLIYRRVFASRTHGNILKKLGIEHTKGILLYGPPGTGKTLMAREISKILDVEPKIVNGPELMDKFVGEGQRKLRALFEDAIREYREKGESSGLHVIIFDEFDAIARQRGSSDSSIGDSLVNQLLTLIDGVDSPKNVLIIGMTNRKDLIDDALLRSGRLEVHVEVNLPDEKGREEIFHIHTAKMRKNGYLEDNIKIEQLSKNAKNYTGAEIEGLVRNAASFAMEECKQDKDKMSISQKHFDMAKSETIPQFGQDQKYLESIKPKNFIRYSPHHQKNINSIQLFVDKVKNMSEGRESILITGAPQMGKSTLAALAAQNIGFSFIKFISCDKLYSLTEAQKVSWIIKIFEDAKKCKDSCIILDDLFRLIEFIPMGNRFNNVVLQLIINLMRVIPESGKRQVIIATANEGEALYSLGLLQLFSMKVRLPMMKQTEIAQFLRCQGFSEQFSLKAASKMQDTTVSKLVKIFSYSGNNELFWQKYEEAYRDE